MLREELGLNDLDIDPACLFRPDPIWSSPLKRIESTRAMLGAIHYHHYQDLMAPIASGSFLTSGMVICPCSGSTLGAISHAMGTNLIHRAAEVHLKEPPQADSRPARNAPLAAANRQHETSHRSAAYRVVLPASPGFYHGVEEIRSAIWSIS